MKTLDVRILDVYESLTPLERRLADVVLEHQRDLASYSATELARRADVSKATAARLFKRLGYGSFAEARRQVRSLKHWGSPLNIFEDIDLVDDARANPLVHLQNDIANLTRTFEALSPDVVQRATDMLIKAAHIWVVGFRANYPLAESIEFWLKFLKPNVHLLPSDGMAFGENVIDMREGDVLVAVGFRRRSRIMRVLLEKARDVGLEIILLTDLSASATAKLAHIVVRCHSRPSYVFDSYVSVMSVMNYLTAALALQMGDAVRERMRHIDQLHEALDAFTTPSKRG